MRLGVRRTALAVLGRPDSVLDGLEPVLEVADVVARHLAGARPTCSASSRKEARAAFGVGDRHQLLRLREQPALDLGVGERTPRRAWSSRRRGPRRRRPGRRGSASTASRRRPARPGPPPSSGSSGRGTPPTVAPHSVDDDSASASVISFSFAARASSRLASSSAKCCLRRRVYVVRADENRCHSSSSLALSIRGSSFQVWSRSLRRLAPLRQSSLSASRSASAAICCLRCLASSVFAARSARRSARRCSISGVERVEPVDQRVEVADGLRLDDALADLGDRRRRVVG